MLESASPNVLQTIEANQFEYRSGCGALTSLLVDREATNKSMQLRCLDHLVIIRISHGPDCLDVWSLFLGVVKRTLVA
jgi:hypothetical protein